MLDLHSLELQSLWKLALMFQIFQRGEHGNWDDVRIDHADRFDTSTRHPQPVNADGEIVTQTPVRIEVLKKALRVCGPCLAGSRRPNDLAELSAPSTLLRRFFGADDLDLCEALRDQEVAQVGSDLLPEAFYIAPCRRRQPEADR